MKAESRSNLLLKGTVRGLMSWTRPPMVSKVRRRPSGFLGSGRVLNLTCMKVPSLHRWMGMPGTKVKCVEVLFVGGLGGVRDYGCDPGCGVQRVAGAEVVVALAVVIFSVPDGDALGAVDGEGVAVDCHRGALVEAEAEEIGVRLDDGGEIVLAMANVDVLVDGDVGEEAEADLVAGSHHDGVVV